MIEHDIHGYFLFRSLTYSYCFIKRLFVAWKGCNIKSIISAESTLQNVRGSTHIYFAFTESNFRDVHVANLPVNNIICENFGKSRHTYLNRP